MLTPHDIAPRSPMPIEPLQEKGGLSLSLRGSFVTLVLVLAIYGLWTVFP